MLIRKPSDILPSEITDQSLYISRRMFMKGSGAALAALALGVPLDDAVAAPLKAPRKDYAAGEQIAEYETAAGYNNFYEFSTDKEDVAPMAKKFRTRPWQVTVEGEVSRPLTLGIEDIFRIAPMEERVYRLRCVEGWSMVIPWVGFPLAKLLARCAPLSTAKFVEFTTLYDPAQMPNQKSSVLPWPYREALRMDEAYHPLALAVMGMYGETLPPQNGAPLRIILPWKYGFKSAKSIVSIRFTREMPATTWAASSPHEYGFYANVNPAVDHPRWSQANERRLGEFFRRKTLPFNGYADQVAHLYRGMDLKRYF